MRLGRLRVGPREEVAQERGLGAPAPDAASMAVNVAATSSSVGLVVGRRRVAGAGQHVLDRQAQVGVAVVGGGEVRRGCRR